MKRFAATLALALAALIAVATVRLPDMWDDDPHYRP